MLLIVIRSRGFFGCKRLPTLCLEHDCLERDTRRIGAEFARKCFGKGLNHPLWIDAAARSYLIDQRVAQDDCSGISRHIGDYLIEAQHSDPEVGKTGFIQRVFDRANSMVTERYMIELWRIAREKSGKDFGD
jgi:hypothetical protein